MMLCEEQGNRLFSEQKHIITELKEFTITYQTHVLLVAHPKKQEDEISGATEIKNASDTILMYVRVEDEDKPTLIKHNPSISQIANRISAYVRTLKVRDDGRKTICWLEWDSKRGALYDLSSSLSAGSYERKGYWTKSLAQEPHDIYV